MLFWLYDFVQILLVCGTIFKEFMERLPMSALAAVAGKSLHILFYKYLDHVRMKIEQNRMVRTIQIFELFDQKWLNIFLQSDDALLEDVSVTETIVWCKTN